MPKNVLHDVMMKEQRSIRHVPMPKNRRGTGDDEVDSILYEREEFQIEEESPSSWRRVFLWGATFLFLALLVVSLATGFTGATVTVTPKTELLSINKEFTASKSADAKLRFETLPIQETAELVIPADTTRKIAERASGTLLIYNTFSDKPQRLIKNTRFETRDGLIYRIANSITIPGKTVKDGRSIPGSIEATVFADSPGKEYNIPLSDFTVPGFKGDSARFAGFYARSKTPMTGGFDGTVKIPSEDALTAARASLRKALQEKILTGKRSLVPEGYILWDGAISVKNESLAPEERSGETSAVKETVTGAAYIFKREDIAKAVAATVLPPGEVLPVEIPDLDSLTFEIKDSGSNTGEATVLRFTLKGGARIVWLFDEEKLQKALTGKPKDELAATLSAFPTIEKVDLVLKPFWSRSFPNNPSKVTIERATPEASPKTQ